MNLSMIEETISKLYKAQLAIKHDPYLYDHSCNKSVLRRHLQVFKRYREFVSGKVLDWGCRHAVDACVIKMVFGNKVELFGCDIEEVPYKAFFDFSNLNYTTILHPYRLPYEDDAFDTIVGSGVLEHVPSDTESLKEIYRVLKPGGHFIITFLPNKFSYTEALSPVLGGTSHRRKYTVKGIKTALLHNGFEPISVGRHQILPALSSGKAIGNNDMVRSLTENLFKANSVLENVWPINLFSSNIFVVSKKHQVM